MDQEQDWAKEVARGIGRRVAFYRERRELSAQQTATRCAELGMPSISRVVITKLENGRRESVSTAEAMVLARALGVPPVLLLFPLGRAETVEVLPGEHAGTLAALTWFTGSGDPEIELFMAHKNLAEAWPPGQEGPVPTALMTGAMTDDEERRWRQSVLIQQQLRQTRAVIREHGLTPPGLPPDLAWIDNQETARGAR